MTKLKNINPDKESVRNKDTVSIIGYIALKLKYKAHGNKKHEITIAK